MGGWDYRGRLLMDRRAKVANSGIVIALVGTLLGLETIFLIGFLMVFFATITDS